MRDPFPWIFIPYLLWCSISVAEGGAPKTGYAQTIQYIEAVSSRHRDVDGVLALEAQRTVDLAPYQRAYFRMRGSRSRLAFDRLYNNSDFAFIPATSVPSVNSLIIKGRQMSFAWGYLQDNVALELEVYLPKGFTYVAAPALNAGASFTYAVHVQQIATYFNLNYILMDIYNMQPYLAVGVGVTGRAYRATVSNGATGLNNYISMLPAWNAGIGVAIQLSKNVGVDAAYRQLELGHAKLLGTTETDHYQVRSTSSRIQGYMLGVFWRY